MVDEARAEAESVDGAAPSEEAGDQQQTRTPEQVEAEWQAKQSALGRQHAATEKALRDQIAALQAEGKASGDRTATENDAIRVELENTKKLLAETQRVAIVETRRARFPNAAEALDAEVLATMDEAKLAGLEARLAPQPSSPPLVSSTPGRSGGTSQKPMSEKTSAELEADLRRFGPQFAKEISGQY